MKLLTVFISFFQSTNFQPINSLLSFSYSQCYAPIMISPGKNIPLFSNPLLEKLSHVHPVIPGAIFIPVIIYCVYHGAQIGVNYPLAAVAFIIGAFSWSFVEYSMHRGIFHFPPKGKWGWRFHYLFHGIHHDDPNDARRLVMPPVISIPLSILFYSLYTTIFGEAIGSFFFAGFTAGYLGYDYTHFYVHHGRPKSRIAKFLHRQHMLHHFHNDEANYGVSSPLWDIVFRTFQPKKTEKVALDYSNHRQVS